MAVFKFPKEKAARDTITDYGGGVDFSTTAHFQSVEHDPRDVAIATAQFVEKVEQGIAGWPLNEKWGEFFNRRDKKLIQVLEADKLVVRSKSQKSHVE